MKDKSSHQQREHEKQPNLGQKDAQEARQGERDMRHMGEHREQSRSDDKQPKKK